MATPRIYFIQLLTLCCSFSRNFVCAQEGFFFTIPKVLREGDVSEFCLTAYSSTGTRNVTMALINKDNPDIKVEIDDVYMHGQQKCNNFTVPEVETYELILYNDTDILHETVEMIVRRHSLITLIQTDKPIYNPGQKVKFRILAFHSNGKPRTGNISAVYVKDTNESRVKQFLNVDAKGIASLEFQLSKEAKHGRWQILVFLNETDLNANEDGMVSFEVKEYVLPRYEVTITPPIYILATDETVEGKICAKYTYGKDVQGFLELKVCGTEQWFRSGPMPCHHEVVEMTGCYNFTANMTDVTRQGAHYGWQLKIDASVTEAGTGFVVNATHKGPSLTKEQVILALNDYTNGFFKTGLPFHGKVVASKPDGTPATGELISVTTYDYDANIRFTANLTTDELGVASYALCGNFAENVTSLSLMAKALNYTNPAQGLYTPSVHGEVKQWFSPSFSYIGIPSTESKFKCGERLTLSIPFTTRAETNTEFHYQIIARGKVVKMGSVHHKYDENLPKDGVGIPKQNCLVSDPFPARDPPKPINPFVEISVFDESDMATADGSIDDIERPPPPPPLDDDSIPPPPPALADILPPPLPPGEDDIPLPPPIYSTRYEPREPPFKEPVVRSKVLSNVVSSFMLDIPITTQMSPKFSLLVHHVLPDGEVVADSMEFEVEPCFDNNVKLAFNSGTVLPGEEVNLRLEAEPGSVCGLGIIDKSVNILGGSHQITMDTIFDKLESLSISQQMSYSYQGEREYCEQRLKKYINEGHYWDISSQYVDAKQAFKSSGLIVMTDLKLETRPCGVSAPYVYDFVAPVPMMGVGGPLPMPMPGPAVALPINTKKQVAKTVDIRSHFPETWLWDLQVVGKNGSVDLPQKAPHTITSWVGNALCMDSEKGVGVSSLQSLITFQPFFIHLNLPYSAVRGERLPVMFTVHNYLDKCLHMQLSLHMGKAFKVHNSFRYKRPFCVCSGNSYTAKFYATALEIGSLPILAQAKIVPGACNNSVDVDLTYVGLSDAVKRKVLVKAEGVTKEYTNTLYLCGNENKTEKEYEDVILPLPEDIVKDSESGDVQVIGDIMGPALTNLDHLVRMPTGCGEQNMVGFTPNIFVLKYLSNTGLLTEEIYDKAIRYMEIGYQRELNYRHKDGSFSAFGEQDERGSVWLTAFVVKSFAQATPYIFIDPKDMEQSIRFLRLSQSENGCFIETGKVFSSYMMGGLGKKKSETALTSYVLIALLKAGVNSSETVIVEGFKCIEMELNRARGQMDSYSLALSAYANNLNEPSGPTSMKVIKMLETKANKDGLLKYWNRVGVKPPSSNTWFYGSASSAEVEMTAYALMAYIAYYGEEAIPHSHGIAMWLSRQRNPYGGFASTQDTVVGLNAMSEFALMVSDERPINVRIKVTGKDIDKTFLVSEKESTKLLVQKTPITHVPNRLTISTEGEGCALVQVNVRYNKLPYNIGSNKPGYHLKVMPRWYKHDQDRCDRRTINIAVGTRARQKYSKDMTLVVVKLVTSWAPVDDSLIKIKSQLPVLGMKRYEYDEIENVVTFYFDSLGRMAREFTLDVEQDRELAVSRPKAGQVSVINYYDTDVAEVKSYTLKTICGTKAEIPRKRVPVLDPRRPIPVQTRIDLALPILQQRVLPGPVRIGAACPICRRVKSIPPTFKNIICNATHIYKTYAGRRGQTSLKIRHDLRPEQKVNINKFANFTMPADCECSLLNKPAKRVFIITSSTVKEKTLQIDAKSAITHCTKKIEREILELKNSCPVEPNDGA